MQDELTKMFEELTTKFEEFTTDHQKFLNGNNAAGTRARTTLGEIKNLVTPYRKLSTDVAKSNKEKK